MRFAEALAELHSRQPERMVPDLARIIALATLLDDPQLTYPTIHVTGTNGKTTTSRLIAALACAHGITTGLYTSPHLESVVERISVCGVPISEDDFAGQYERLLPYLKIVDVRGERVTYFETLTALAYVWFSDLPVSLGVFEVGMGGEWDATNLVAGDVAVVCPIAQDHPELGPALTDKAREKAAIIKGEKIAVVREQAEDVLAIIEARARDVGAELLVENVDFGVEERAPAVGGQVLDIRSPQTTYPELVLPLFGEHAALNAAAAITALEAFLGRPLNEDAVRSAFAEATSPGRLEVVARHPLVLLDGAHNPAGAAALAAALEESFTWDRLVLVAAASADKDVTGLLEPLVPLLTSAIATRYQGTRALEPEVLGAHLAGLGVDVEVLPDMRTALKAAAAATGQGDCILVTGSLFAVAEARAILTEP